MKRSIFKFSTLLMAMAFFVACSDDDDTVTLPDDDGTEQPDDDHDDDDHDDDEGFAGMESDWVRLSLLYEDKIETMQAASEEIIGSVDTGIPQGARYYTSDTGRYLTVINTGANETSFFDTGVVNHSDHGHQNQVRWLNLTLETAVPVHYTSVDGNIVIFNDGDGSITYVEEEQLELPAYTPMTMQLEGTVGHHGVGFRLDSGKFAVTFQSDTPPAGFEWGPQMVKFVTSDGAVIEDNGGVEVQGIHGSANNGTYGAFGSSDGVILVDDQDNISLISYPEGFNSEFGNWLGNLKGHYDADVFFGRAGNLGVFMIDPEEKTITSLYSGDDVVGDMFNFDGEYYLVHTADNKIQVFDGHDGTPIVERVVEMADIPDLAAKSGKSETETLSEAETPSPVLVASDKFLYVLAPNRTQIKVLEIDELKHVHTIELDAPVESIMKNGFSIEGEQHGDHDH